MPMCRDITEIQLKTALNNIQSINQQNAKAAADNANATTISFENSQAKKQEVDKKGVVKQCSGKQSKITGTQ